MFTVGYGDIYVQATISRIFIFIIVLSGQGIISIMIIAQSQFLSMDKLQNLTLDMYDALELKIEMRHIVSEAIIYWSMMLFSAKK